MPYPRYSPCFSGQNVHILKIGLHHWQIRITECFDFKWFDKWGQLYLQLLYTVEKYLENYLSLTNSPTNIYTNLTERKHQIPHLYFVIMKVSHANSNIMTKYKLSLMHEQQCEKTNGEICELCYSRSVMCHALCVRACQEPGHNLYREIRFT